VSAHDRTYSTWLAAIAGCLLWAAQATAQNDVIWNDVGVDNWNVGSNWDPFGVPPDVAFDEVGVINNGGTAFLSAPAVTNVGGVVLGRGTTTTGGNGTLEIRNGGSLTAAPGTATTGALLVGNGRTGTLVVQPGGSLSASVLTVANSQASSAMLGGTTPGTTTVSLGAGVISKDLRIIGPNVQLSTTGHFDVNNVGRLIAEITGTTHSTIQVGSVARLGGALRLEFNGYTPAVGNAWNLIDAGGVIGDFSAVTSSATLGPGQKFVVSQSTSGSGTIVGVSLQEVLVLRVNRTTGQASINNVTSNSQSIRGYAITSPSGAFNVSTGIWSSLADQGTAGWQEANPSPQLLAELNPGGDTAFGGMSSRSLGTPYAPMPAFGSTAPDDVAFTYDRADGKILSGIVEYIGNPVVNNLVLSVDPATGNARITNFSPSAVAIDGYTISSASLSLLTSYMSLHDQATAGWDEANLSTARVSELNPTGSKSLANGASFNLSGLFKTAGGMQDLQFTFHSTTLGTFDGVVRYESLSGLAADFNDDGTVNGADLTIWKDAFGNSASGDADGDGDSDGADFLTWQRQVGSSSSAAAAAAVPEPTCATLTLMVAMIIAARNKWNR